VNSRLSFKFFVSRTLGEVNVGSGPAVRLPGRPSAGLAASNYIDLSAHCVASMARYIVLSASLAFECLRPAFSTACQVCCAGKEVTLSGCFDVYFDVDQQLSVCLSFVSTACSLCCGCHVGVSCS